MRFLLIIIAIPVLIGLVVGWRGRRRNRYNYDLPGTDQANADVDRNRSEAYGKSFMPPGGSNGANGGVGGPGF